MKLEKITNVFSLNLEVHVELNLIPQGLPDRLPGIWSRRIAWYFKDLLVKVLLKQECEGVMVIHSRTLSKLEHGI